VQAVISANSTRRGDLEMFLTSPMGTRYIIHFILSYQTNKFLIHRSMILSRRSNDDDHRDGFTKWPFMTTQAWGEHPQGKWLLEVSFNSQEPQTGWLKDWSLVLHGTKDPPYLALSPQSPHSKLAIVKKAHEDRLVSHRGKITDSPD
jgi:proprotein convertase subtilisin/kexin type 2